MPALTLAMSALITLATAALYAFVGRVVLKRKGSGEGRLAIVLFATWWFAVGLNTAFGGVRSALAAVGVTDLVYHATLQYASLLPLTVAVWGLVYYLLYLYTGQAWLIHPVTAVYAGLYLLFMGIIVWQNPVGVDVAPWMTSIVYERQLTGTLLLVVLALLVLPVLLAAIAYGTLFFRLDDPSKRYRTALISGALVLWFGSAFAGAALGLSRFDWWPIASRAIGLAAPLIVLLAYYPPTWVRSRYGVRPFEAGEQ